MRRCEGESKKGNPKRGHHNHRGKGIFEFFGHTGNKSRRADYPATVAYCDSCGRCITYLVHHGRGRVEKYHQVSAPLSEVCSSTNLVTVRCSNFLTIRALA